MKASPILRIPLAIRPGVEAIDSNTGPHRPGSLDDDLSVAAIRRAGKSRPGLIEIEMLTGRRAGGDDLIQFDPPVTIEIAANGTQHC